MLVTVGVASLGDAVGLGVSTGGGADDGKGRLDTMSGAPLRAAAALPSPLLVDTESSTLSARRHTGRAAVGEARMRSRAGPETTDGERRCAARRETHRSTDGDKGRARRTACDREQSCRGVECERENEMRMPGNGKLQCPIDMCGLHRVQSAASSLRAAKRFQLAVHAPTVNRHILRGPRRIGCGGADRTCAVRRLALACAMPMPYSQRDLAIVATGKVTFALRSAFGPIRIESHRRSVSSETSEALTEDVPGCEKHANIFVTPPG